MSPYGLRLIAAAAAFAAVLALVISGCGGGKARPSNGRYSNQEFRYAFDYPKEWEDVTAKVKLAVEKGTPNVLDQVSLGKVDPDIGYFIGVQVSVIGINHTVAQAALEKELTDLDALFQTYAGQVRGKLKEPQWAELGGLKARQYVVEFAYTGGNQQLLVSNAETVTFFGDRQYIVNCQGRTTTFDNDVLGGCEKILQTFRFK